MKVVALLEESKNGVLPHGLISSLPKIQCGMCDNVMFMGLHVLGMTGQSNYSLEINSQKNETGRNPKFFMEEINMAVNQCAPMVAHGRGVKA